MPGRRKLGRPTAHRIAMLRGMVTLLLENGQIETTLTRAKEVRSMAEKMITLGKKNTLASRRAALAYITKEDVVSKLFNEIAPGYAKRNGGYTQIFKLGARRGDAAEMAIVRLIDKDAEEKKEAAAEKKPVAARGGCARECRPYPGARACYQDIHACLMIIAKITASVSCKPLGGSCTISWVKLERQAVEVEEGGSEEEGQGPKAEGKAKEGTPPWGRRAKNKQRRRNLWYDESC